MPVDISAFFRLLRSLQLTSEERQSMQRSLSTRMQGESVMPDTNERQYARTDNLTSFFSTMKQAHPGLTPQEKDAMRFALQDAIARTSTQEPESLAQSLIASALVWLRMAPVFAVLIVLFVGAGGVFASEAALPGDMLYPLKIHVNERLRASIAWSIPAQVRLQMRFAERRLEEAEELAASSRLDIDTEQSIAARFQRYIVSIQNGLQSLKTQGDIDEAAELAAAYESSLMVHDVALHAYEQPVPAAANAEADSHAASKTMLQAEAMAAPRPLRSAVQEAVTAQQRAQEQYSEQERRTAAEAGMRAAIDTLADVRAYVGRKGDTSSSVGLSAVQVKLSEAKARLESAHARLKEGSYIEASSDVRASLRSAQEAKVLFREGGAHAPSSANNSRSGRAQSSSLESSSSSEMSSASSSGESVSSSESSSSESGEENLASSSSDGISIPKKVKVNISF